MADEPSLSIGRLARAAGVNRETLRYHERLGLLPPDERTAAGYRLYGSRGAERLRFIKRAQAFGFSLEEIRELLSLRPQSARSCDRVMAMLDRKLDELETQLAEMRRFHVEHREGTRQARGSGRGQGERLGADSAGALQARESDGRTNDRSRGLHGIQGFDAEQSLSARGRER